MKKKLIKQGCIFVNDLLTVDGNIITYQQFQAKYRLDRLNVLDYYSLIKSIPRQWTDKINLYGHKLDNAKGNKLLNEIVQSKQVCKLIYSKLLKKLEVSSKARQKWNVVLNSTVPEDKWKLYNCTPRKITMNTKLISFQYKVAQHILCTNKVLKKCNKRIDDNCTFCKRDSETTWHLLWECQHVNSLWIELKTWLQPVIDIEHLLSLEYVLLGYPNPGDVIENLIVLRTKYYIYCKKCCMQMPSLAGLKQCLKTEWELEKCIAIQNGKLDTFKEKWKDFDKLL